MDQPSNAPNRSGGIPQPIRPDGAGAPDFGPRYVMRDLENPDLLVPPSQVPGPLETQHVPDPYGTVPQSFTHRLLAQKPIVTPGGTVRIVDSSNFPVSVAIAAALVEIKPGAMREMHWHPNNDEWQYYLSGTGSMTVFAANGNARTFDYRAGDVGYVPFAFGHYV